MRERVASLDLVRGLAALFVAIPHYLISETVDRPITKTVAALAVEVFFVLSGFVLAPQIMFCLKSPGSLRTFLIRRWMRTVPPYLVALIAISLVAGKLMSWDFLRYAGYLQNLIAQHNAEDYFTVAWSLSVEEWFYVTLPLLLLIAANVAHRDDDRFCLLFVIGFIGTIALGRTVFGDFDRWDSAVRRVTVFRIDSIAAGFLLYLIIQRLERLSVWASALGCAGLFVGATVIAHLAVTGNRAAEHLFSLAAAAFGAAIILVFFRLRDYFKRSSLATRACLYLGTISYSIYLFHTLFIAILRPHIESAPVIVQLVAYALALIGFCSAFYYYFERPILAARPRYKAEGTHTFAGATCKAA